MKNKKRKKSVFREYAETIILAFLIAMVIRTFIIQAYKIPTGSMEPTLHGDPSNGDRIFVNKFIYRFKPLKRGEIIVFTTKHIPGLGKKKDYIKRLVGLPGEEIEIKNNSVYIDGNLVKTPIISQNEYFNTEPLAKKMEMRDKFRIPPFFFLVSDMKNGDYFLLSSIIYDFPENIKPGDKFDFNPIYIRGMPSSTAFKAELIAFEGQLVEFRDDGIYVEDIMLEEEYKKNRLYVLLGQYGMRNYKMKIPVDGYYVLGDNSANSKDGRYWGVVPAKNIKGRAMFIWWPPKRWQNIE